MLNRVVLVGRLTKDPEFSMTPSGVEKATFTLAVNRTFSNAQGEREADFIYCVVWRKQAVNVNNFLKKGNLTGVDGRIQTRSYEGQDGKRIYVTEVVAESVQFLEPKNSGQSNDFGQNNQNQSYNQGQNFYQEQRKPNNFIKHEEDPFANMGGKIDITEDDLPF